MPKFLAQFKAFFSKSKKNRRTNSTSRRRRSERGTYY